MVSKFENGRPEGHFFFNQDIHHIASGISKCIKDNEKRFFMDLVDYGAGHQNPDGDFKKGKDKRVLSCPEPS